MLDEGALQRMTPAEPFDRRHVRASDLGERHETGIDRDAIDEHRARTALAFAASLFGPCQPTRLA